MTDLETIIRLRNPVCTRCDGHGCAQCKGETWDAYAARHGEQGPDAAELEKDAAVLRERQRCAALVLEYATTQAAMGDDRCAGLLRAIAANLVRV